MFRSFTRLITFGFLLGLAALPGCGGSDGPTKPGGGGGTGFSATINGQPWEAASLGVAAAGVPAVPGGLIVTGAQTVGGVTTAVNFSLFNIKGVGTYPLGVTSDVFGGIASVGIDNNSWLTAFTGQAGSISITTLTATRLVATFQFSGLPGSRNTVQGTKTVTAGRIDLPLQTPVPVLAEQHGRSVTATLNGADFVGSTVVVTKQGAAGLGFSALDGDYLVSLDLTNVTTADTYTPQPTGELRAITVIHTGVAGTKKPAWGLNPADTGSIVVTSVTAGRFKGTFNVTLHPQSGDSGATGTVALVGAFDIGTP